MFVILCLIPSCLCTSKSYCIMSKFIAPAAPVDIHFNDVTPAPCALPRLAPSAR